MPARDDVIDTEVREKFSGYSVDRKSNSNNGRHYVLQNAGITYHLKVVSRKYIDRNEESEIELLKNVESDYVIKLLDSGELNDDWSYLLFPHINGQTLDRLATDEGWDGDKLQTMLNDVVMGFKDLHSAGIIHRDIKPKNIIYDNVNRKYIILDLGIGCYVKPTKENTKIARGIGARFYSAPEQLKISTGELFTLTQATDQFSLGVIAYELAMAKHPFISPSQENAQYYANVLFQVTPGLIPASTGIDEKIRNAIYKMLSIEPSHRYLTNDDMLVAIGMKASDDSKSASKMYLKMPKEGKDSIIQYALENQDTVEAVVLTPSDGQDIANRLDAAGVKIVLDTTTFKLQTGKEQQTLSSKLSIVYRANHNMLTLYQIKNQLLDGVYNLADKMHSSIVVTPYFRFDGQESLLLTREIWAEAKDYYREKGLPLKPLYGGVVIPKSTIVNETDRSALMSGLMGCHNLDGIIISFENSNTSIATISEEPYLKGCKELINFFEKEFSDVIITRSDVSMIPLSHHSSYVAGWAKSFRHFNATAGGGGNGNTVYKMKYYAPGVFTFLEEKSIIQTIVLMGKSQYLACSCNNCAISNPLDSSYTEDELYERTHYFRAMSQLQLALSDMSRSDRKDYFINYINECNEAGDDIKSSGVLGSETIPSYIGLMSVINH